MIARRVLIVVLALIAFANTLRAAENDLVAAGDLARMNLQRYWHLSLPLEPGECVCRLALLDDSLYAITSGNRALSVHSATGVVRWSNIVADEGKTLRGPSHSPKYVFFTTSGSVQAFDRQTGDLAGLPRTLRGVVIEVVSETATISIGSDHGVRMGELLNVYRAGEAGSREGSTIAQLRITSIHPRSSRGHLERVASAEKARPGDKVEADVTLPLEAVKLPFAASSAAVADDNRIYVGSANQRFYAIDILTGVQRWQLLTPNTVTATPVIWNDSLYIAGQDGLVVSCTKNERAKNWVFQTEAPIFADLFVDASRVYVASTDRSLYCLDRQSGARLWRERFDTPLQSSPVVAQGLVYQDVPKQGLVVMSAENGRQVWNRPEGGQILGQFGDDVYLLSGNGSRSIVRVSTGDGKRKELAAARGAEFAVAGLKDQSIFLGNASGDLVCLRPANAPRLKPEEVEAALRNDRKIQLAAEMEAVAKAAAVAKARAIPTEPKARSIFEDDDGLASRSTAKPVGGHGVLKESEKPAAAKPVPAKAEKKEGEAPQEAEEGEEGAATKEGEKGDNAKAADEGEEGADKAADEGDEEKPEAKERAVKENGDKATTKKAEDKSDDEGEEEEGGDKEGGG